MTTAPPPERRGPVELLAPAGNFEKLEVAIHYGADAVYLAGRDFSLRSYADNFTPEELDRAIRLGHAMGIRLYVTCNTFPRDAEMPALRSFLSALGDMKPDAVIVADPGVALMARQLIPHIPLHISTQANTTHAASADFWHRFGASRVNAARELGLDALAALVAASPIEVEAFVHGALCISYSGRCLLSSFMAHRDGNRGQCAQPCRWEYALVEATRPGRYMPVTQDSRGTYIFNSRDLCMIAHLPALLATGVRTLKIEGRMKGVHYLATVVKTYREAIDAAMAGGDPSPSLPRWERELSRINTRGYCTGFYLGAPESPPSEGITDHYAEGYRFAGQVVACPAPEWVRVAVKNRIQSGDRLEILRPRGESRSEIITRLQGVDGAALTCAQAGTIVDIQTTLAADKMDLIRVRADPEAPAPA
ncbi:MAG: U32 family peptidase [Pseudomonadota bacterium]